MSRNKAVTIVTVWVKLLYSGVIMNILIYSQTNFLVEKLVDIMIPRGITPYHMDSRSQLSIRLQESHPDLILVDINKENYESALKLIASLPAHQDDMHFPVKAVMLTRSVSDETIALGLKAGALGYVRNEATQNDLIQYLLRACEKLQGRPPVLQFTRIILDPDKDNENLAVRFISESSGKSILGTVHDLSAGGLVMRLKGNFDTQDIVTGMIIENAHFILLSHEVVVSAQVRAFQQDMCALRFKQVSEQDMHEISQFIYMKLSRLI